MWSESGYCPPRGRRLRSRAVVASTSPVASMPRSTRRGSAMASREPIRLITDTCVCIDAIQGAHPQAEAEKRDRFFDVEPILRSRREGEIDLIAPVVVTVETYKADGVQTAAEIDEIDKWFDTWIDLIPVDHAMASAAREIRRKAHLDAGAQ